jgi:hypothetical protein
MANITLTLDEEVVAKARRLARRNNTSISAIFRRMVLAFSEPEERAVEVPADAITAVTGNASRPGRASFNRTAVARSHRRKTHRQ